MRRAARTRHQGPTYVYPMHGLRKIFNKKGTNGSLNPHKNRQRAPCYGRYGVCVRTKLLGRGNFASTCAGGGPFGNTEESLYRNGELQARTLFTYHQYGHRINWLTLDGAGNQQGRTVVNTDKEGNYTEQWDWGKEGELRLHFRQHSIRRLSCRSRSSFCACLAITAHLAPYPAVHLEPRACRGDVFDRIVV